MVEVRVKFFSYEDNELVFDKKYDSIEEVEELLREQYKIGDFNDDDGELSVFVDGEEKDFELFVKIKIGGEVNEKS